MEISRTITRSELLSHLNMILMVIKRQIERGVVYYEVKEKVDMLESLLDDRLDLD